MTLKAVYENGVLKPKDPLPLKEHEEVEIEIEETALKTKKLQVKGRMEAIARRLREAAPGDAKSFVGFIKDAPEGVPLAQHHDLYLDMEQYGHMTYYLRPLMAAPDWEGLGRDEKLRRFVAVCKQARPELVELWEGMDHHADMWSDALEHCTRVIQRGAAAAAARG
jgi:predicted DNA-binding antitoxin AbrB/MazE fold protein